MKCDHAENRALCRVKCARCGHHCPLHRGGPGGRGVGGMVCWECPDGHAWVEPTGVALLDEGIRLSIEDRHAAQRRYHVTVRARGKVAGRLVLAPGRVADEVMVERVRLALEFRGRGIAAEVYAELARQLVARQRVLTSGPTRTPEAEKVWQGQVARGYAVRTKAGYYRLESPPARPATWKNE